MRYTVAPASPFPQQGSRTWLQSPRMSLPPVLVPLPLSNNLHVDDQSIQQQQGQEQQERLWPAWLSEWLRWCVFESDIISVTSIILSNCQYARLPLFLLTHDRY